MDVVVGAHDSALQERNQFGIPVAHEIHTKLLAVPGGKKQPRRQQHDQIDGVGGSPQVCEGSYLKGNFRLGLPSPRWNCKHRGVQQRCRHFVREVLGVDLLAGPVGREEIKSWIQEGVGVDNPGRFLQGSCNHTDHRGENVGLVLCH